MKHCLKCDKLVDSTTNTCQKCGTVLGEQVEQKLEVTQNDYSRISVFLATLGVLVILIGSFSSLMIASNSQHFDIIIFVGGIFSSLIGGGLILGISEIINKLHHIEINTRK